MRIEQLYTGCLSEAAYYIESDGEAAIIDPLREPEPYLNLAKANDSKIKYIFETHFHADFVSGHLDLAKTTGAKIVFGPGAETAYQSHIAKDNEVFHIGRVKIKVLHTPGHTLESVTYLLYDENGNKHAIFTGDTLFLGDVGRPDLAVKKDISEKDLAGMLYDSLQNKILPLPDEIIVYPGHGAGSACGKNMSKETVGTLGEQKQSNYALDKSLTKEKFIEKLLDGILPPPAYFSKNAGMNKNGYDTYEEVIKRGDMALSPEDFKSMSEHQSVMVLDVRSKEAFAKAHIPGSVFIGLDGSFAPWVGALVEHIDQAIILVTPEGREKEAITRLSRVGYDQTLGYLKGGITAWKEKAYPLAAVNSITAQDFENKFQEGERVLDVRKQGEFDSEHMIDAQHFPLDYLNDWVNNLNKKDHYYVHCAGGYRPMIAISLLQRRGFKHLTDVAGGFSAIKSTSVRISDYVCPSQL